MGKTDIVLCKHGADRIVRQQSQTCWKEMNFGRLNNISCVKPQNEAKLLSEWAAFKGRLCR